MIEALRGLGYSAGAAIADIIDNSISAGANVVSIQIAPSVSGTYITIADDGCGMNALQLEKAMTLGDRNPLHARESADLGRFGLGLKTASFSQCRRLTVASRNQNQLSVLRWDLDFLASSTDGGWYLLEGFHPGSEDRLSALDGFSSGTLVLLELLDRMLPHDEDKQELLDVTDQIERHLSMVFHRFLLRAKLKIIINGAALKPWDPFLKSNSFTWHSNEVKFGAFPKTVTAQSFVLPHRDRLTAAEYDTAGGPDGWTSQQGFYVYRNERLLLAGSWLGLGKGKSWTKDEPLRLARIRVDIQNTADADWKIDIRKATAHPPTYLRKFLTSLAEDTRMRARNVFAFRGKSAEPFGKQQVTQTWRAHHHKSGVRYKIDPSHPAIEAVLASSVNLSASLAKEIRNMLRIIEETVPVQRIWLDTAEAKDTPETGFANVPSDEVVEAAQILLESMVLRKGMAIELARASLLRTEPFNLFPELVINLQLQHE
ncbi:hypothetical protein FHS21_006223 [Phyllobacterium trifolii]|uniref:ATP-binding protein n=1 Tax=Phyllobacterium trifolii TaxID=300193 RepID=A0A839UMP9_9HYPH|nr:ATP-binding protein [Phyllobacterium trifolii]MBB3149769.1 hypothetical protein [Phyllobacterium trifolii]